jgi:hypothetical protein
MSANPFGGEKLVPTSDFGSVSLRWGLGLGAYLLMAAGAILIVAGVLQFAARKEDRNDAPAPGEPVPVQQPVSTYAPGNYGSGALPPKETGPESLPLQEKPQNEVVVGKEEGKSAP